MVSPSLNKTGISLVTSPKYTSKNVSKSAVAVTVTVRSFLTILATKLIGGKKEMLKSWVTSVRVPFNEIPIIFTIKLPSEAYVCVIDCPGFTIAGSVVVSPKTTSYWETPWPLGVKVTLPELSWAMVIKAEIFSGAPIADKSMSLSVGVQLVSKLRKTNAMNNFFIFLYFI